MRRARNHASTTIPPWRAGWRADVTPTSPRRPVVFVRRHPADTARRPRAHRHRPRRRRRPSRCNRRRRHPRQQGHRRHRPRSHRTARPVDHTRSRDPPDHPTQRQRTGPTRTAVQRASGSAARPYESTATPTLIGRPLDASIATPAVGPLHARGALTERSCRSATATTRRAVTAEPTFSSGGRLRCTSQGWPFKGLSKRAGTRRSSHRRVDVGSELVFACQVRAVSPCR